VHANSQKNIWLYTLQFTAAKKIEDEQLDQISAHLDVLKAQSETIAQGIAETGDLIDEASDKTDVNQGKVEANQKNVKKILTKKSWW
jgi:hypothetical protein